MLTISGTDISLTRGDSAYINIGIKNKDGTTYTPDKKDIIRAQVRSEASSSKYLFESIIDPETLVWHILPEDTENATMGKTYKYDMQIEINSTGDTFTFIPESNFTIAKEVTRVATDDNE